MIEFGSLMHIALMYKNLILNDRSFHYCNENWMSK